MSLSLLDRIESLRSHTEHSPQNPFGAPPSGDSPHGRGKRVPFPGDVGSGSSEIPAQTTSAGGTRRQDVAVTRRMTEQSHSLAFVQNSNDYSLMYN